MGNLNFQDEHEVKPQQTTPPAPHSDDHKIEDIFGDESSSFKYLWLVIVIVIMAGIGGGLYLLNKYGYLNLGHKSQSTSVTSETTSTSAPANLTQAPIKSSPVSTGKFALQLSAFRTKELADNYVLKLKRKGIDAYVFSSEAGSGKRWFKVLVGSFDTKLRAIAAIENMKKKVGTDVWVVPAQ
jgi:septal ring-binding cell division protein DamX